MPAKNSVRVRVYDGTRQFLADPKGLLIRIIDGNHKEQIAKDVKSADTTFTGLPFFDNFGDDYTVLASKDGYVGAGFFPVTLNPAGPTQCVDLILLPKDGSFNFEGCSWEGLLVSDPVFCAIVGCEPDDAKDRYEALRTSSEIEDHLKVADLQNIFTAMAGIHLRDGTPLKYLRALDWDEEWAPRQDRFFGWAEPELVDQVRLSVVDGHFSPEPNPKFFHPGATSSYKENTFGEANVQLTFHGDDKRKVKGTSCILVEPDIDYYKDLTAHGILEVVPGLFPNRLTDPRAVYALRWMATRRVAGVPAFEPRYTIENAKVAKKAKRTRKPTKPR
jgi:hypothetical protein